MPSATTELQKKLLDTIELYRTEIKESIPALPANFMPSLNHIIEVLRLTEEPKIMLAELALLQGLLNYLPILQTSKEAYLKYTVEDILVQLHKETYGNISIPTE